MGFSLDQVVPWGRNLEEYQRMFSLTEEDLNKKMLGCADGPASVNAELHEQGKQYVSLDPVYQFSPDEIESRVADTAKKVGKQLRQHQSDYRWDYYSSPEALVEIRLAATRRFLTDFEQAEKRRYVAGSLLDLPFDDHTFDLVLCANCLFSYSEQFDEAFHHQAIQQMCRVGKEVRIFPLVEIDGSPSRHLSSVLSQLEERSIPFSIVTVDYEFQKGSNQLLTIKTS